MKVTVQCKECGSILNVDQNSTKKCPNCGSIKRHVKMFGGENIQKPHERMDAKIKEKGNKKPSLEIREGDDLHRKSNKWYTIKRKIDRKNNEYEEKLTDPNGHITRNCKEKLTDHFGHGSAKKK